MVTAEAAVTIPALVLVLALCLGAVQSAVDRVRCVDGVRAGARAAARGDLPSAVHAAIAARSPAGARIGVQIGASSARVTVATTASAPWSALGVEGCRERAELPLESADPP